MTTMTVSPPFEEVNVAVTETDIPYTPEAFPGIPDTIRELVEGIFKGAFPEIPLPADVDIASIRESDADPFFITLPIVPIGIESANGWRYTQRLAESIRDQINAHRSIGIRGHLSPEERATEAPVPAIYWLAAEIVGDKLWAKAYVPPGETRNDLRTRKSLGMKVATSFYGKLLSVKKLADGTLEPAINLEQVDIAEVGRAAHGQAFEFAVTSEMASNAVVEPETPIVSESEEKEPEMADIDVRALLTEMADEALYEMCGEERMGRLADMWSKKKNKKMVAAELEAVGADVISELRTNADQLPTVIAELDGLRAENSTLKAQLAEGTIISAIDAGTDWHVTSEAGKERLTKLRNALKATAVAEMAKDNDAAAAVERAFTANELLVETTRDVLAGPGLPNVLGSVNDNQEIDLAKSSQARARFGI